MSKPARAPWSDAVGYLPHKVIVEELPERGHGLYLRWREAGNWKKQSLRRTLTDLQGNWLTGRALAEMKAWALAQATAKYRALTGEVLPERPAAPLTLGETRALLIDRDTGKYPVNTPHRREVLRSLAFAVRELGEARPWASLKRDDLTTLWRRRIQQAADAGEQGVRTAEIIVRDVLAIAGWLRDHERIPADACLAPRHWKQALRQDWAQLRGEIAAPAPHQPRHSLEEFRAILKAAWTVDPRLGLLLALGAELRSGQVERCRRSHLDLTVAPHGQLTVPGKGKKGGAVVVLTAGQRADVERTLTTGYLRRMEDARQRGALDDYALFPAGQLRGGRLGVDPVALVERHRAAKPMHPRSLQDLFRLAEDAAGVPRVAGRVFYGLRRRAVDETKARKASREALQAMGGWADAQVPDMVYADAEMTYARQEAAEVRAAIRGEAEGVAADGRTQDVRTTTPRDTERVRGAEETADA